MDGGRENRFLAGGAEISRRGGGITAAPQSVEKVQLMLGFFYYP